MLSFYELRDLLANFSYKPGWKLTVWEDEWQGTYIYIYTELENAYNPEEKVPLKIVSFIPPMRDYEDLTRWLFWRLRLIEIHECMEWFKLGDKVVYDPHKPIDPDLEEMNDVWNRR